MSIEKPDGKLDEKENQKIDSFGNDTKKSPWLLYALLQIPILIGMALILYFAYQQTK